jgi:hypothetical protein
MSVKYLPLMAVLCMAALTACEYKHETTVQQPQPATSAVVTPAPGTAVVTTQPAAPASTTTVYTR